MNLRVLFLISSILLSGCNELNSNDSNDKEYILLKVNNYSGLLQLYRERLQKKEDPKTRYKVAEYYHLLADYESSRHFLSPLLNSQPTAEVYLLESRNLLELGKKEEALVVTDKAIAQDATNGELHNIRGVILAEMGYFDESIKSFNRAREKLLADNIVMNNIAMVYILKEDYNAALNYLFPMYQRGDKSPKLIHNLLLSLIKTRDYIQAEKIIQDEDIPEKLEQLIFALDDIKVAVKENTNGLPNRSSIANNPATRDGKNTKQVKSGEPVATTNSASSKENTKATVLTSAVQNKESSTASFVSTLSASSANNAVTNPVNTANGQNSPQLDTKPAVTETNTNTKAQTNVSANDKINAVPDKSNELVIPPTKASNIVSADKATVTDVRMGDNSKGTRLVIESTKEIKFNVLGATNGNELTVELINLNSSDKLTNTSRYLAKNHKTIENISFGSSGDNKTMVFKFKKNLNTKVYHMGPEDHYKDRVVIDIAN